MTTKISVNDIVNLMENACITKDDSIDFSSLNKVLKKDKFSVDLAQRIALHLTCYIFHFGHGPSIFSVSHYRLESLFALRKWAQLTELCKLIGESFLKLLNDNEKRSLLFDDGLCVAMVIYHFSKLFSDSEILPGPFIAEKVVEDVLDNKVQFYSLCLEKEKLAEHFKILRFLQAAYKVNSTCKGKKAPDYIPSSILGKFGLKVERRIPEVQLEGNKSPFFYIEELIPQLKECGKQSKAYLLGISDYSTTHALGVYLSEPFHFIDPSYGIGTAKSLDELLLFLANYLTEKYLNYQTFALLEFNHLSPCGLVDFF